eukprot:GHVT01058740.1.p1 GENE.GHVT01058740.1~~GHVT01058740.1.p1  ORF type:complete len:178 (+),score=44.96 GHVT01058740.1:249-782(+)
MFLVYFARAHVNTSFSPPFSFFVLFSFFFVFFFFVFFFIFSSFSFFPSFLTLCFHHHLLLPLLFPVVFFFPFLPPRLPQSIYVALATSLGLGGASARKEESGGPWERDDALAAALDQFEYVMYGRIFKLEEQSSERRTLYASFGGLLMALTADKQVVGDLDLDMRVYILLKQGGEVY